MSYNVRVRYEERVKNGWDFRNATNWKKKPRDKFSSGKNWQNDLNQLPTKDSKGNPIFYREHDVNEKISKKAKRDAERILTGHDKDGKLLEDYIYHTKDHYENFIRIILD